MTGSSNPLHLVPSSRSPADDSHRGLLWRAPANWPLDARRVDAVVVPTVRLARHLTRALDLAKALDCPIIVFCSGAASAVEVVSEADRRDVSRVVAVDLPPGYELPFVELRTSYAKEVVAPHFQNLSLKRNLGLLLARLVGWKTVLFLDDDVRGLTASRVSCAAGLLNYARAAAFAMVDYPDHSVVYHGAHIAGGKRDTFVSGGACVLDPTRLESFCPAVYNEDWLFLFDALAVGRVAYVGEVKQSTYDPFDNPIRARNEEFGDVLAEGLLELLGRGGTLGEASSSYWARCLARRRELIERTASALVGSQRPDRDRALAALVAAEHRRRDMDQYALRDYVAEWRADVRSWRAALETLPRPGKLRYALDDLDLSSFMMCTSEERSEVSL